MIWCRFEFVQYINSLAFGPLLVVLCFMLPGCSDLRSLSVLNILGLWTTFVEGSCLMLSGCYNVTCCGAFVIMRLDRFGIVSPVQILIGLCALRDVCGGFGHFRTSAVGSVTADVKCRFCTTQGLGNQGAEDGAIYGWFRVSCDWSWVYGLLELVEPFVELVRGRLQVFTPNGGWRIRFSVWSDLSVIADGGLFVHGFDCLFVGFSWAHSLPWFGLAGFAHFAFALSCGLSAWVVSGSVLVYGGREHQVLMQDLHLEYPILVVQDVLCTRLHDIYGLVEGFVIDPLRLGELWSRYDTLCRLSFYAVFRLLHARWCTPFEFVITEL
eukprot:gene3321-2303_t